MYTPTITPIKPAKTKKVLQKKEKEKEEEKQGAKAVKNGKFLENQVENWLCMQGYQVIKFKDFKRNPKKYIKQDKILLKQVPFDNGIGYSGITEFCIINRTLDKKIRVECKWQSSKGSVDGKLYEAYYNAFACEENHVIIIVDGGGFKEQKIKNIKALAKNTPTKKIEIVTLGEFFYLINNEGII